LSIAAVGTITAAAESRLLSGLIVKYGAVGHTSKGPLRIREGALRFPEPLNRVKLTEEHNRDKSRGFAKSVEFISDGIRASMKVANGPEGDKALAEADPDNPIRDGFSVDVINAHILGDEIVSADVVAIGQVGIPAYSDTRIDSIAASQAPASPQPKGTNMKLTKAERARLAALKAKTDRNDEEEAEYNGLVTRAVDEASADPAPVPDPAPVAPAPAPAAPANSSPASATPGVPVAASMGNAEVNERPGGLETFASLVASFMHPSHHGQDLATVTAALADVTSTQHTGNVSPESWSGELWSGLEYEAQFMDLFTHGNLTNFEGKGWRWNVKPVVGDYAGDKADIPTNVPTTEPSTYEAFRLAGGWDIDRKFFDFPDAAFIASFLAAARESYTMQLDFKVRDYILAQAVAPAGVASQTDLIKAVRLAMKHVKRNTRAKATFVLVNDDDYDALLDLTNDDVPAFLELFGVDPRNFRDTPDIAAGTVYAGVKQAATVRELPGASPLRVEVQNLTKAGIDEAIFGYGAIEEHHETGIVKIAYDATP
jgi:HK97 family phage major capsid protein